MAGNKKDVAADTAPDEDVHMDAGGDEAAQATTEAAAAGESVSWDAGSLPDAGDAAKSNDIVNDDAFEALIAERDSLKDQLLRALADVENMRRRTERELETARKYSHTGFARDLVGAIDNLARAVEAAPKGEKAPGAEAVDGLVTGIEMSWQEIQTTMERHGIRRISPKGEKFDYNFHQAMFEMPSADLAPGTVVEVVQHGYVLHDRLLRPAMVGVSKAAEPQENSGDGAEKA